jgi:putative transposase
MRLFLARLSTTSVRPLQGTILGFGPVKVQKPKARDRGAPEAGERIRFASSILPKWARRTKSLDALLPAVGTQYSASTAKRPLL